MGMNGNLYLLYGNDAFLIKNKTDKILADAMVDPSDVETFDLEESSMEDAIHAAMTIPFLSERKGVVLRNCAFLTAQKIPKESESLASWTRYLQKPNPTTILVMQAPFEKIDTRKTAFRICQETCQIEECVAMQKDDMYRLVKGALAKAGKTMDANALEEFVNRTETDGLGAINELDKLFQYADQTPRIDIQMVRAVTTRNVEDNVFELVNALLAHDTRSITRIYQDLLRLNTDPNGILGLIAGKFQEILYTKELMRMKRSEDEIMRYFGASKRRVYYIQKNAKDLSDDQLARYMTELEKIDFRIKSGALDKKMGLELFLLGI
jgi:DNA polymerase-3 subunit delta